MVWVLRELAARVRLASENLLSNNCDTIFRCPVHITRESDAALLQRLGILPPEVALWIACCRTARSLLPEVNPSAFVGGAGLDSTLQMQGYSVDLVKMCSRRP